MADTRQKDPVRVLTGRLGALATHARGRTNTAPASAAFLARFEAQVDPTGELDATERRRRAEYAKQDYMTRLALHRHRGSPRPVLDPPDAPEAA